MIQRSLQASVIGIKAAKIALIDRFSNNQQKLADALEVTRQPVNKFFNHKPVDSSLFVQICEKLGLKWQEVVADNLQSEVEESLQDSGSATLAQEICENVKPNTKQRFEIMRVLDMTQPITKLESPDDGPVALDSDFYVERPPRESESYQMIIKPGALIRVKAPRQMGKTSLMMRILQHGTTQSYQTVQVDFRQLADKDVFTDLDKFLRRFCAIVGRKLGQPNKLADHWDEIFGSKGNCTVYFEEYLLKEINQPIVLGLDNVDLIFPHQVIADDFFGLLRAWHEGAKSNAIWQKLRLVIVHSQEAYIPRDINQSPFNVGLPIELPELDLVQIQDLVKRHGLNWTQEQVEKLMLMVGGHPYLVRVALYKIALQEMTLERLLEIAPTEEGLYRNHLLRHLSNLEQNQELLIAMKEVVSANKPVMIKAGQASQLHSMGLVKYRGNYVQPLCNLYCQYFCERLRIN